MNDLEKFFKAFARDRKILGEELTIGIYEDIFSYFLDCNVKGFKDISDLINEDGTLNVGFQEGEELCEGVFDRLSNWFGGAKEGVKNLLPDWFLNGLNKGKAAIKSSELAPHIERTAAALNTAAGAAGEQTMKAIAAAKNAAKNAEKAGGFGNWLMKAKDSIKGFFKGDRISRLLNNGVAWFTNPANGIKILGGAGGLILLTVIIKSLKKRKMLNKYKHLQDIYNGSLKEEQSDAYLEIMEECKTNKKLAKLFLTDEFLKEEYHNNYMNY